jgi:hypothetical protein
LLWFQRFSVLGRRYACAGLAGLAGWKARERWQAGRGKKRCGSDADLWERGVCDGESTLDMGPARPVVRPVLNNYISGRASHTSETILEGAVVTAGAPPGICRARTTSCARPHDRGCPAAGERVVAKGRLRAYLLLRVEEC